MLALNVDRKKTKLSFKMVNFKLSALRRVERRDSREVRKAAFLTHWGGGRQQGKQAMTFFQDTKPNLNRQWFLLSNLKKDSRVFGYLVSEGSN